MAIRYYCLCKTPDLKLYFKILPLGLSDCFAYKDQDGNSTWCPYFIPMGVCGTCFMLGKIRTIYVEEQPCCLECLEMGPQGLCLCVISCPINFLGPLGGFCWFCWHSAKMRHDITQKYNIDDSEAQSVCCFKLPTAAIGEFMNF